MEELSREGHRQRAKKKIVSTSIEYLDDYLLLEALLFYSIPRIDVKPVAYNLINRFGSLSNVLSASIEELIQVDGVGENTATLIKISKTICDKANINRNKPGQKITNYITAIDYVNNIVCNSVIEEFIIITLDNNMEVISNTVIAQGYSNHAKIEPFKIVERALNDRATSVIVAHNHPNASPLPSDDDVLLTANLSELLKPLKIKLRDHIIIGKRDSCSMSILPDYCKYFKNPAEYDFISESEK